MPAPLRNGLRSLIRTSLANPPSGQRSLYAKSDGWYDRTSGAVEAKLSTQADVDVRVAAIAPGVTMTSGSVGTGLFRDSVRDAVASGVTDTGDISASAPFAGAMRFFKTPGNLVVMNGGVSRATSFSTSFIATGVVVPVGMRPPADVTGPTNVTGLGGGHFFSYQIRASDGAVLVRMSAAGGLLMAANMPPWPTA